jgi:hypothetical protein
MAGGVSIVNDQQGGGIEAIVVHGLDDAGKLA